MKPTQHTASGDLIPATEATCLGLDMELTITRCPEFFSRLATSIRNAGGRVIVVSQRPTEQLAEVWRLLDEMGLPCNLAFCLPQLADAYPACPHRNILGWHKSFLWHKVRIAWEQGVTHFVDDDPVVHGLFRTYLPTAVLHYPWVIDPACRLSSPSSVDEALYRQYESQIGSIPPDAPRDECGQANQVPYASGIENPVVYSVCAEGDDFGKVIAMLGGQIWGAPPMHLTGSHLVVLPGDVNLPHGIVSAGGATCFITYVHRY